MTEPRVGIFWLVGDQLVIDGVPLSVAEPYGDHLTHPRSHIEVWTELLQAGKAPHESEYEEFPRGRVMHCPASGEYTILADRCILERKDLIARIEETLHLPHARTKTDADPHYRCYRCLYGDEADEDWGG